jgi:hypothetical protein
LICGFFSGLNTFCLGEMQRAQPPGCEATRFPFTPLPQSYFLNLMKEAGCQPASQPARDVNYAKRDEPGNKESHRSIELKISIFPALEFFPPHCAIFALFFIQHLWDSQSPTLICCEAVA